MEQTDETSGSRGTNHLCWIRILEPNLKIVQENKNLLESLQSQQENLQKIPGWEKPPCGRYRLVLWYGKDMGRKHAASWANKKIEQLYQVSTLGSDDHQFQKEELETIGSLPKVCSPIVLKCLYLARKWYTWHSLVRERTWSTCHKMESSLWQTLRSFALLHSSHEWSQTILPCG